VSTAAEMQVLWTEQDKLKRAALMASGPREP